MTSFFPGFGSAHVAVMLDAGKTWKSEAGQTTESNGK